jgi:hypothetical protein
MGDSNRLSDALPVNPIFIYERKFLLKLIISLRFVKKFRYEGDKHCKWTAE